ncbi:MAG: hypothetical protein R3D52_10725 [Xanthobacteraceae bacterium]
MIRPTYRSCHKDWGEVATILRHALEDGVPEDEYVTVTDCLRAAEDELTTIEDQKLQNSEEEYKALTEQIKGAKNDLEEVKDERNKIIKTAAQAEKMLALLTKLIPLLA